MPAATVQGGGTSGPLGLFDALHHQVQVVGRFTDLRFGSIKDTHVRHGLDAELLRDRGVPVYDVDFDQDDIRILFGQLFELGADPLTGNTPLRVEIHNRDFAHGQKRRQIHLFAPVGNDAYFD